MKSIDNVLKPLGERFSSPLYSTFLIAWCVSNWKIFYVTFIIPSNHLSTSKLYYVQSYLGDCWHMWIYPLAFTGVFIFLLPFLEKEVLKIWYKNKAERKTIIVNKMEQSPVTGEEYRNLLIKYADRENELTHFFERERSWYKEKEDITSAYNKSLQDLTEAEKKNSNLIATMQRYQSRTDASKFFKDNRWKLSYRGENTTFGSGSERFFVTPQNDYQLEGDTHPKYKIVYFFYDELAERIYMLKEKVDEHNPEFFFNDLRKIDDVTYEGREFGIRKSNTTQKHTYMVYSVTLIKSGSEG